MWWVINIFTSFILSFFDWKFSYRPAIKREEPVLELSANDKYKQYQKNVFMKSFDEKVANENIEPVFYIRPEYNKIVQFPNNHLECKWKTRLLIESVDNNIIIMFYDAYKEGFSYYSDRQVNYDILNAVSMKYCRTFLCRDFFMDESYFVTDKMMSPFLKIRKHEEAVEREKQNKSRATNNIISGPFAKLKKYSIEPSNKVEYSKNTTPEDSSKPKDINKNKFIYLGKITNFHIIKTIPKTMKRFSTELSKSLVESSTSVQNRVLSYREFKSIDKSVN